MLHKMPYGSVTLDIFSRSVMNNVRYAQWFGIYLPRSGPHYLPLIAMASVQFLPTIDDVVNLKPSDFSSFVFIRFVLCVCFGSVRNHFVLLFYDQLEKHPVSPLWLVTLPTTCSCSSI
jgi:hypothetical protein